MFCTLAVEATVVGLVMLAIHYGLSMLMDNQLLVVFLTGFVGHLLFRDSWCQQVVLQAWKSLSGHSLSGTSQLPRS